MTVFRSRSTPIARIVSAVLAAAAVAPAVAQEASVGLEEVLVTATRAGITNLQQTPVSVSAVTAEDIDRMVARDISGIASSVPGFSASRITAFNAASFAMRGVGLTDIIVYQDAPVGVTMDDFVLPSVQTQLLDTFDIESVEILRGPQGTLFGKNTTGGAVNIRSKRPDMDEMGADFSLGYGSFNAVRAQGSIDVPVIDDVLALRFVGAYSKSDGYYKLGANYGPINTLNIFAGTFAPFNIPGVTGTTGEGSPSKSSGGDDNLNGRIKAQWNPTDNLKFLAQYEIMRDRSDAVPAYNDTPPDGPYLWNFLGFTRPNGDPLDNVGSTQRQDSLLKMADGQVIDVDGIYLNMEWDVGYGTIYANAGKRTQDEHLPNTYTGAAPVNQATGEVISLFDATRDTTRDTTQFEARFASDFDGAVNFVAGVFQQTNDAEFCVVQVLGFIDLAFDLGALGLPQQLNNSSPQVLCNKQDSDSLAGYVDATWEVTDQFSLTGGYRMTRDERSWTGRTQVGFDLLDDNQFNGSLSWQDFSDPLQAGNFNKYPGGIIVNDKTPGFENLSETWTEPSWRIVGSYKFTDKLFGYATISEGYKAGGYNDQTGTSGLMVSALTRPVDPEFATNYEIGMKWESEDGRFRLNPTAFFTTYDDAQRAVNILTVNEAGATFQETVFYNAAEVEAKGIELEFQAAVTDNFRLRAQASYLNAEYKKFVINQPEITDPVTGATIQEFNGNFSGLPVPRSPELMGSIQGVYTWELASGSRVELGAEYYHEDENLFYISAAGRQFDAYLDAKDLLNASLTYVAKDARWFVRGYGKNLTDERYRIASQSVATLWTHSQFGPPINFGVEFGMGFGSSQ
ncbi:MAG: TonB-dependent receptor [Gammaproteobacteria bacterium]|nr:TonB-dependent receptor [Gammaproteobacteria bacterium]MDH5273674.1 TonB-dependent receptor [Gammaproteobacteria bacterium]